MSRGRVKNVESAHFEKEEVAAVERCKLMLLSARNEPHESV